MAALSKKIAHFLFLLFFCTCSVSGQNIIEPVRGYSPQIGVIVSMLEDLKGRVTRSVANLDVAGTDFLLDEEANRAEKALGLVSCHGALG